MEEDDVVEAGGKAEVPSAGLGQKMPQTAACECMQSQQIPGLHRPMSARDSVERRKRRTSSASDMSETAKAKEPRDAKPLLERAVRTAGDAESWSSSATSAAGSSNLGRVDMPGGQRVEKVKKLEPGWKLKWLRRNAGRHKQKKAAEKQDTRTAE